MLSYIKQNKDSLLKIMTFAVCIVVLFLAFNYLMRYIAPFVIGFVLSKILIIPSNFIHKKLRFSSGISAIVTIAGFLSLLYWIGQTIVKKIILEAAGLFAAIPVYAVMIADTFAEIQRFLLEAIGFIPLEIRPITNNVGDNLTHNVAEGIGVWIKNASVRFASGLPSVLMVAIISLIATFFFLKDYQKIGAFISRQIPKNMQSVLSILKKDIVDAIIGYFKAQLIIMGIVCAICTIGLLILKMPFALFIGLIISAIDALPVFGSGFILWPMAAFHFINKNYTTAIGLLVIYVIVQLTRQTTEPKIIGSHIGVHPLATLSSIYIGLRLCGIMGIFLGPLFIIVIKSLQKSNLLPRWK